MLRVLVMLLMTSWSLRCRLHFTFLISKVKREKKNLLFSFSQLDLDFSLRGVFTTWAVHVLGKNRDLGEEIIGKDPYLLGSVVTCEWM